MAMTLGRKVLRESYVYIIVAPDDTLCLPSTRSSRVLCIREFLKDNPGHKWIALQASGYSVRKIKITYPS